MARHGISNRNYSSEGVIGFCDLECLIISGTLVEFKAYHRFSWVSTDWQRISNQMEHIAIDNRFRSCLLNVPDIFQKLVVYFHFRAAAISARKGLEVSKQ